MEYIREFRRLARKLTNSMKPRIASEEADHPMKFKQVNSSLLGGLSPSYLTEPVHLRLGNYKETIQFVVAPKMAEAMILWLSWLSMWNPAVHWGKDARRW